MTTDDTPPGSIKVEGGLSIKAWSGKVIYIRQEDLDDILYVYQKVTGKCLVISQSAQGDTSVLVEGDTSVSPR